jgi:hypothetical protein
VGSEMCIRDSGIGQLCHEFFWFLEADLFAQKMGI